MGEVSPYVSTPRCARVCHYPLRGDTPRRPVQFLAKQDFAAAQGTLCGALPKENKMLPLIFVQSVCLLAELIISFDDVDGKLYSLIKSLFLTKFV